MNTYYQGNLQAVRLELARKQLDRLTSRQTPVTIAIQTTQPIGGRKMTNVKWMAVITEEQRDWIRSTAKSTNIKGAAIVRAAIDRAIKDKEFRSGLAQAQLEVELELLQEKRESLEAEIKDRQKRMKEVLVTA